MALKSCPVSIEQHFFRILPRSKCSIDPNLIIIFFSEVERVSERGKIQKVLFVTGFNGQIVVRRLACVCNKKLS